MQQCTLMVLGIVETDMVRVYQPQSGKISLLSNEEPIGTQAQVWMWLQLLWLLGGCQAIFSSEQP